MKNLILIRHAKSSWEAPIQDFERGLTRQGVNDAHEIALKLRDLLPQSLTIWCSAARRTTSTSLIFAQNIGFPLDSINYKHDLYTFETNQLEKVLKGCSDTVDNLMVLGHNNALTDFANKWGSEHIPNIPTAGVVFLQFESDNWQFHQKGKTKKMLFPKDLK